MATFLFKYTTALIKFFTSYPALIAVTLLVTAVLYMPVVIGTNTGEDGCVYTGTTNRPAYVKEDNAFVKYDPALHGDEAKTYVLSNDKYYRNKANWQVMNLPCRLTKVSLIMGGILFWLTFTALGAIRMALRFALRIKPANKK
jgi:hypothetical protein